MTASFFEKLILVTFTGAAVECSDLGSRSCVDPYPSGYRFC